MTDADQGKLIFTLTEAIDDLSRISPDRLMKDSASIAGAALALMLIASSLTMMVANKDEVPKVTVN